MLVDFFDTCVISRLTGTKDEWDEEATSEIYSGPCLYTESRVASPEGLIVHMSEVFIESNDILIYPNDKIDVTTQTGRHFSSVIGEVRDVRLTHITRLHYTKMVLTQTQEAK